MWVLSCFFKLPACENVFIHFEHLTMWVLSCSTKDMILNNYVPTLTVDPETYVVTMDGQRLTCEPLEVAPLAQLYSLF